MFRKPVCSSHAAVAESLLTCCQGVLPGRVGLVMTRWNGYEILDRASEDAFCR